jgi:hypothetical protein
MMNKKLVFASLFAAALMAACGGDGDNSREELLRQAGVTVTPTPQQAQMTAPAPIPQTATQPAVTVQQVEVIATQIVEVTRIVKDVQVQYVEVTPQPEIAGFVDATNCDPYRPMPTVALDDADRAAGVVLRGQWCGEVTP